MHRQGWGTSLSPKSYSLSVDCPPCLVLFKMADKISMSQRALPEVMSRRYLKSAIYPSQCNVEKTTEMDCILWPVPALKKKSENCNKKAHGSLRILNHPLAHNHSSLRHITAHPKMFPFAHNHNSLRIPLRILNLPFVHNHNSLRLVRKSDCKPP